ncbi:flagellar biosynthetic protein FliO [uncultured Cohaesibacter sp.]|uniref:flagellar biosynthetic protein FliO n=1 Tax=uncultured Cohaesibacter sp. TaxID=1002546 RepID=UPI00292D8607|nr:flagellar biosynthetic protein FliO [uncultured Cohaesibacter sp.]
MLSDESGLLVQFLLALGVVLILILLLAWIMKKLNVVSSRIVHQGGDPRLSIKEAIAVDHKRKLVLVSRDHVEHLLLIGGDNDLLVEHHIMPMPPQQQPHANAPIQQPPRVANPAPGGHRPLAPQSGPLPHREMGNTQQMPANAVRAPAPVAPGQAQPALRDADLAAKVSSASIVAAAAEALGEPRPKDRATNQPAQKGSRFQPPLNNPPKTTTASFEDTSRQPMSKREETAEEPTEPPMAPTKPVVSYSGPEEDRTKAPALKAPEVTLSDANATADAAPAQEKEKAGHTNEIPMEMTEKPTQEEPEATLDIPPAEDDPEAETPDASTEEHHQLRPEASYDDEITRLLNELSSEIKK